MIAPRTIISGSAGLIFAIYSWNESVLVADREMSVITTYLNDNAQTPLGRFVVYMLYRQLCNKYSDKSN